MMPRTELKELACTDHQHRTLLDGTHHVIDKATKFYQRKTKSGPKNGLKIFAKWKSHQYIKPHHARLEGIYVLLALLSLSIAMVKIVFINNHTAIKRVRKVLFWSSSVGRSSSSVTVKGWTARRTVCWKCASRSCWFYVTQMIKHNH
jgi:hypothetical protein